MTRGRGIGAGGVLLCAVLASAVATRAGADPPTAHELLRGACEAFRPAAMKLQATLVHTSSKGLASRSEVVIRRDPQGRIRVDFLAPPKDEGKVILFEERRLWLYLPRARKFVEVSRKNNPLAGGVLFDDLLPENLEAFAATMTARENGFEVELRPASGHDDAVSRILFDRTTRLPVKREISTAGGKLVRTIAIERTQAWRGLRVATRVRIVDHLRGDAETAMEVHGVEELEAQSGRLFERDAIALEREHP